MASSVTSSSLKRGADELPRFAYARVVACVLLALMGFLAGGAALRESVTFDEVAHIGAGVSYIQKLDLRFNEEHPPLPKVIAAIPLALRGVHAEYDHVSWTNSTKFVPHAFIGQWLFGEWLLTRWNDLRSTLAWARLPMLLLTLLLGWVVFVYARKIGGDWGGLLCVAAYASTPTFIVFGPLVHTDLAITLFSLLTVWQLASLWREPCRKYAVRFGLCLAAALLSKFSAGLLFFVFAAVAVSNRFLPLPGMPEDKAERRAWRRLRWRWTLKGAALAAVVVYCFYFLFSINQPTDALSLVGNSAAWTPVRRVLMPPWLYLRGLLIFAAMANRPTFLLGHGYSHGVWFYFPVIATLKSTLGFLGLLALSLTFAVRQKRRADPLAVVPEEWVFYWRALWVSLAVFTAACMAARISISIRHFSVPLVLLILMLAPLPRMIQNLHGASRFWARGVAGLTVLFAAASLFTVVRTYPYYFPFLNSLAWRHPVYWWASDSNVDWNQALPEVKRFADERGLKTLNLDPLGLNDFAIVVPQARLWDCQQPTATDANQWVVVSSNMILDSHNCGWLVRYPHQPLAGGAMWAFQLPSAIPPAGSPEGPPAPSQRKQLLNAPQDPRAAEIKLSRHPNQFPKVCAEAEAEMRKQLKARGW